jgi:hypothetical protein
MPLVARVLLTWFAVSAAASPVIGTFLAAGSARTTPPGDAPMRRVPA